MSNLLDKASVILTPTAYNNGEALCVKPSDGSGDFDFSRNSAATRVNAQGLVENVQILSSNLVQNGDFSEEGVQEVSNGSFSQEGVEEITNGDFSSDTGWIKGTGWTISGGSLNASAATAMAFQQNTGIVTNKTYKVTYTISNYVSGSVRIEIGSANVSVGLVRSADGTYTEYITALGDDEVYFDGISAFTGSIENCSVREVGQNWALGTGWSIGEDKAERLVAAPSTDLVQLNMSWNFTSTYKISFDVEASAGSVRARIGQTNLNYVGQGTHTFYAIPSGNNQLKFQADSDFVGSITNISVKEVGQNWNFDANWSIGNNKAISTGAGRMFQSIPFLEANVGTKVKVSFDIVDYTSAGVVINCYGGVSSLFQGVGSYSFITTTTNTLNLYVNNAGAGNLVGSITNLSVIAITSDTNLPRINYEGFSYQDALGSEEVVNGSFDTDTAWSKGTGWSIANGTASHIGGTASYLSQSILNPNTQYKVKIKVSQASGSNFVQIYMGSSPASVLIQNVGEYEYIFTSQPSIGLGFALRGAGNVSIDNVSVKEYLGQEVVPNSGCGSWLFEPQSTNLYLYSEPTANEGPAGGILYENFNWAIGFTNCVKYGDNSVGRFRYGGTVLASTEHTLSAFVIMDDLSEPLVGNNSASGDFSFVCGGVAGGVVNSNVYYGNNIYRVSATIISGTNLANNGIVKYTQQSNKGFRVVGYQLEQQSYATSYIPTSGSSVTRNQDLCTNGGSLATINSTEGVLYAEIKRAEGDATSAAISLNDGTSSNGVSMYFFGVNNFYVDIFSSSGTVTIAGGVVSISDYIKVAVKYKNGDSAIWINGIEVGISTSAISLVGLNQLLFRYTNGALPFFGKTKALAVWKEALSDQELTELTTI